MTTWGRPLRVRTDRSTLFGCVSISPRGGGTYGGRHIQRALAELEIEWMPAETPRVLGHSALFFEKARKGLLRELMSARVRTFEGAVRYLESVYLPHWNAAVLPAGSGDRHRPLLAGQDLASIFSVVEPRQIFEDCTIRFDHARYRIMDPPCSLDFARSEIQIERRADGKVVARWNGKHLRLKRVEKDDVPSAKPSSTPPRKPRAWNRTWMNGFFDRLTAPIWKISR